MIIKRRSTRKMKLEGMILPGKDNKLDTRLHWRVPIPSESENVLAGTP
jgi:hypothetical protein